MLAGRKPSNEPYQTCRVCGLLMTLPETESAALQGMLDSPGWTAIDIVRALQEEGFSVGRDAVRRHRRGECWRESRKKAG